MRLLKVCYLLVGLALLGLVLASTDLGEVAARLRQLGWGFALVFLLSGVIMLVDSLTWQIILRGARFEGRWVQRIFTVRLVGEAFNSVVPAGGFGGEPVKAVLLNRHYGVGYREGAASIVLGRTVNMMAQVLFLAGGAWLAALSAKLPDSYKVTFAAGLVFFTAATVFLYVMQRYRLSSRAVDVVWRWRLVGWLQAAIRELREVEERFVGFYTARIGPFAGVFALALASSFLGMVEVYFILALLGHPVSWAEAWIIDAAAQLVRAATFFIPASIGAQEGGFLLVTAALTGLAPLGVALALVRRLRELVWIAAGFGLGFWFSLAPRQRQ